MTPLLLLTRPLPRAEAFREALGARAGFAPPCLVAPLVRIVPLAEATLRQGEIAIMTSPAALGSLPKGGGGRRAYCVGDGTAEAARAHGFEALSAQGDAGALLRLLLRERPAAPLVHLRGRHVARPLVELLRREGFEAREEIVYRQEDLPPPAPLTDLLASDRTIVAPVFSPKSAKRLASLIGGASARVDVIAISQAAAEALEASAGRVDVAASPSGEAMLDAVAAYLRDASPC